MTTPSASVFLSNMELTSASTGESSRFLSDLMLVIFIFYNNAASHRRRVMQRLTSHKVGKHAINIKLELSQKH